MRPSPRLALRQHRVQRPLLRRPKAAAVSSIKFSRPPLQLLAPVRFRAGSKLFFWRLATLLAESRPQGAVAKSKRRGVIRAVFIFSWRAALGLIGTPTSKDEIGARQSCDGGSLDDHFRRRVGIIIDVDEGVGTKHHETDFANGRSAESTCAAPGDSLIAGRRRVGIDQMQIDLVVGGKPALVEKPDRIPGACRKAAIGDRMAGQAGSLRKNSSYGPMCAISKMWWPEGFLRRG